MQEGGEDIVVEDNIVFGCGADICGNFKWSDAKNLHQEIVKT